MRSNLVKKIILLSMMFFFLFTSDLVHAQKLGSEDIVIIVGKPYKVKDSPNEVFFNKVSIGSKYIVYFKDFNVVSGELKKRRRVLKVEMIASSSSVITYPEEIYVIIKKSNDKVLEAWSWGIPKYSICLPVEGISELGLDKEFNVFKDGIGCKGIYQHGKQFKMQRNSNTN